MVTKIDLQPFPLQKTFDSDESSQSCTKRKVNWDSDLHLRVLTSSDRVIKDFDVAGTFKLRKFMKIVNAVDRDKWRVERICSTISPFPEDVKEIRKMPKKETGELNLVNVSNKKLNKSYYRLISKQMYVFPFYSDSFQDKIEDYLAQYRTEFHRRISGNFEIEILDSDSEDLPQDLPPSAYKS